MDISNLHIFCICYFAVGGLWSLASILQSGPYFSFIEHFGYTVITTLFWPIILIWLLFSDEGPF